MNDERVESMVEDALSDVFGDLISETEEEESSDGEFTSIEEYKRITGKRFRMTKREIQEGLTRQQAFERRLANGELKT